MSSGNLHSIGLFEMKHTLCVVQSWKTHVCNSSYCWLPESLYASPFGNKGIICPLGLLIVQLIRLKLWDIIWPGISGIFLAGIFGCSYSPNERWRYQHFSIHNIEPSLKLPASFYISWPPIKTNADQTMTTLLCLQRLFRKEQTSSLSLTASLQSSRGGNTNALSPELQVRAGVTSGMWNKVHSSSALQPLP